MIALSFNNLSINTKKYHKHFDSIQKQIICERKFRERLRRFLSFGSMGTVAGKYLHFLYKNLIAKSL
jgi:hypothetical protein